MDSFKYIVCTGNDFGILDDVVFLRAKGVSSYPNVGLICAKCYHVNLFNAAKSGIMDEVETAPAIRCQECLYEVATVYNDDEHLCTRCYNHDGG